jgi:uncharacterized protein with GYD domain
MPTYMILFNYTEQGIRAIRDAAGRLDGLRKRLAEMEGELSAFYLTLGPYDTVAVVNLPDDEAVARLSLLLGSTGNVRTVTMRAFPEPEYREILKGLPT